jgi:hypothetical protein
VLQQRYCITYNLEEEQGQKRVSMECCSKETTYIKGKGKRLGEGQHGVLEQRDHMTYILRK